MKKKALIVVVLACVTCVCAAALFGCSSSNATSSIKLDNGTATATGDELVVELESNPTTGYTWAYSIEGTTLELVSEDYTSSTTSSAMTGAPGTQKYTFKKTGAGDATISFDYARSWETTDSDIHLKLKVSSTSGGTISELASVEAD